MNKQQQKMVIKYKDSSYWIQDDLSTWVYEETLTTYVRLSNGNLLAIYGGNKFEQYNVKNMIQACWNCGPTEFYLDSSRFKVSVVQSKPKPKVEAMAF